MSSFLGDRTIGQSELSGHRIAENDNIPLAIVNKVMIQFRNERKEHITICWVICSMVHIEQLKRGRF